MNAFMGLFTWAALLSPEPLQFEDIIFIGNDTSLQIYVNARIIYIDSENSSSLFGDGRERERLRR